MDKRIYGKPCIDCGEPMEWRPIAHLWVCFSCLQTLGTQSHHIAPGPNTTSDIEPILLDDMIDLWELEAHERYNANHTDS